MAEPASLELQRVGQSQRLKKCHHCGRTFSRTEHLQRHQRIHTQEAPFPCPHCHRRFQRSDVQHRHVAKHCSRRQLDASDPASNPKHRVRIACDFCHSKKLRCYGSTPCSSCKKANRDCTYLRGKAVGSQRNGEKICWNTSNASPTIASDTPPSFSSWSDVTTSADPGQLLKDVSQRHGSHLVADTTSDNLQNSQFPSQFGQHQDISMLIPAFSPNVRTISSGSEGSDVYPDVVDSSHSTSQHIPSSFEPLCQAIDSLLQANRYAEFSPAQQTNNSVMPEMQPMPSNIGSWDLEMFDNMQELNTNQSDLFHIDYNIFNPGTLGMDEHFNFNTLCDPDLYTSGNDQGSLAASAQAALSTLEEHTRFSRACSPHSRHDATRWMLTPPSMQKFDRQIINCFLSKFMKHVAPTFSSFFDFKVDGGTTPEKILAMASVGGLFCTTDGSFTMARAMCSDSRRLLFAQVDMAVPERKDFQICLVQTYMVVELFGICSGDKRLFECSEAFHMQMLQTMSRCNSLPDPISNPDLDAIWQRLIMDVNMLECYRVVLFQRPPNLYPISIGELDLPQSSNDSFPLQTNEKSGLLKIIRAFMTPGSPAIAPKGSLQSLHTLAALLVLSWHSMPIKSVSTSEESLWKRPFFELALNRWLRTHEGNIEDSTMLLFHLSSIVLHTSMTEIHSLVHSYLQHKSTPVIPEAVSQWRSSDHGKIAVLHAGLLIRAAQRIAISQRPKIFTMPASTKRHHPPSVLGEGPHAAICVYLGVLILWAAEVASDHTDWAVAKATIEKGCNILSQFKIRIGAVLMNTLRPLEEKVALER